MVMMHYWSAMRLGILDKKYPISVSDASIVINVKLEGKYRSLGYKYFADAADDQKNISYIQFRYGLGYAEPYFIN